MSFSRKDIFAVAGLAILVIIFLLDDGAKRIWLGMIIILCAGSWLLYKRSQEKAMDRLDDRDTQEAPDESGPAA